MAFIRCGSNNDYVRKDKSIITKNKGKKLWTKNVSFHFCSKAGDKKFKKSTRNLWGNFANRNNKTMTAADTKQVWFISENLADILYFTFLSIEWFPAMRLWSLRVYFIYSSFINMCSVLFYKFHRSVCSVHPHWNIQKKSYSLEWNQHSRSNVDDLSCNSTRVIYAWIWVFHQNISYLTGTINLSEQRSCFCHFGCCCFFSAHKHEQ